ncbi:polysaccharide pyruvyl transferase family protein [Boseongicola aestuarii]|uniref:Polysaccharide pyruvyl transferase n=1 Tax=Boseongicola aestuarii TaxID=1470561 RepID=A0A238IVQ1_9RHOB|nr:polysaccharide pyruvyl transferase family protein [Boseongicola aestuarii]SMX22477.1 Polysaccharide pyruvyl transferase [Boseongicola aestuarii]
MGILLMNDTDEESSHFGCMRVMRSIREALGQRGYGSLPSLLVGTDWKNNAHEKAKIDAAQVLVINGEGTLHHGKRKGLWLLEAGERVRKNGGKVALINALWQQNPKEWAGLASRFDLIYCRDSRSASELSNQSGIDVAWLGDLSMFQSLNIPSQNRKGVTVSCSVNRDVEKRLANFATSTGSSYVPVTPQLKHVSVHTRGLKRTLRKAYVRYIEKRFLAKHPGTRLLKNDIDYLNELCQRELLVTGRFHAVCMAILAGTPFVAIKSNSWKIEALLADIGLNPDRIQSEDALNANLLGKDWSFTERELAAIDASLQLWRADGEIMFDRIADLTN